MRKMFTILGVLCLVFIATTCYGATCTEQVPAKLGAGELLHINGAEVAVAKNDTPDKLCERFNRIGAQVMDLKTQVGDLTKELTDANSQVETYRIKADDKNWFKNYFWLGWGLGLGVLAFGSGVALVFVIFQRKVFR